MSEMAQFLQMQQAGFSTAITRYPSGRYGLVGSIPYALTVPSTHGTPQIPPVRNSVVWDTENEAIRALLAIGITRFQLADCSWYEETPPCPNA